YDNPWKALMFLAGVDFTTNGTAYVCSIHGDVWRVTGIDDKLGELHWKRFATGLFQPLGLKVREGQVFVLGRDQITRLHDLNGDGEADFYENFSNLIDTADGHNYVTSLEKDNAGNFYYVDPRGVHRISPDGQRKETLATGFRNPQRRGRQPRRQDHHRRAPTRRMDTVIGALRNQGRRLLRLRWAEDHAGATARLQ